MIIRKPAELTGRVSITRSFSYKLNVGNYESRDFFMSQSTERDAEDAPDISERPYQFCKSQVLKSVNEYMALEDLRKAPQRKAG